MNDRPLHADQPDVSPDVVRRLVARQHPRWRDLPVRRVASGGTTNAIYRLGGELSVRLPLVAYGEDAIDVERTWLPRLASQLPLEIPRFVAEGTPDDGYRFRWSVHGWIDGRTAALDRLDDPERAAKDVAGFLRALWSLDTAGAPDAVALGLRGEPIGNRDASTHRGLEEMAADVDVDRALSIWDDATSAPAWTREPVWFHGDLSPSNLLSRDGRIAAAIDFACIGVGDPACDLMIAWSLFDAATRDVFRRELGVDDATWRRGRGWALFQPLTYIPYYRDAAPGDLVTMWRMLREVLADAP